MLWRAINTGPAGEDRKSFYAGTRTFDTLIFVAAVYRDRKLDREDLRASVWRLRFYDRRDPFRWLVTTTGFVKPAPSPSDFFFHRGRSRDRPIIYFLYAFPSLPLYSRLRSFSGGGLPNRSVFLFHF